jgi:hypothetical protein
MSTELEKIIEKYISMTQRYYNNYLAHRDEKEFDKASEDLWGAINAAASALSILLSGKPIKDHSNLRELMNDIAKEKPEIIELYKEAEKLHANFYHNFLTPENFKDTEAKIEKLIIILSELIIRTLNQKKTREK